MTEHSTTSESPFEELASKLASVVPEVDAKAEHDRWKPGLGPFEEERQLAMLLGAIGEQHDPNWTVETEVRYPNSERRCDLVLDIADARFPIEAKLLRFRLDNGNIDSNCYMSVFSPFPESGSSSLLTDVQKLFQSDFDSPGGVLGFYYEKEEEPYQQMGVEAIAEKFAEDVDYWYGIEVSVQEIAPFFGLRHPHHQQGAVIAWEILE